MKFNEYLTNLIDNCGKKQKEIAEALNYDKPNIITMLKQGKTKVPKEKIPLLAKELGQDPVFMLDKAMTEYDPDTWAAIQAITGPAVTKNEFEMIEIIRKNAKLEDPRIATADQ